MSLNLYDVLDVDPDASDDEIRTAWKNAIADLGPGDRRFRAFNDAAEVLLDPHRRAAYDAELAGAVEAAEVPPEREPEPESDPAPEPQSGPEPVRIADPGQPSRIATWLLAVVGLVAAAVLAVTIWLWTSTDRAGDQAVLDTEANAAAALTAAESAVVPVLSYDYRTFDEDVVDAESYMTTDHSVEHSELMNDLRPDVTSQKLVVEAEFKGSGIVRVTDDRADILILVNQVVRKAGSESFVLPVWATLQMVEEDGTWLVDKVVNEGAVRG